MLPALVMDWINARLWEGSRRGQSVVAVHGEMKQAAEFYAGRAGKENDRTYWEAARDLLDSLIPNCVSVMYTALSGLATGDTMKPVTSPVTGSDARRTMAAGVAVI